MSFAVPVRTHPTASVFSVKFAHVSSLPPLSQYTNHVSSVPESNGLSTPSSQAKNLEFLASNSPSLSTWHVRYNYPIPLLLSAAAPLNAVSSTEKEGADEDAAHTDSSGTTIPDLHSAFAPPSEAFRANAEAAEAARVIAAAALQLEAIVTPPQVSLHHVIGGHFKSVALRVCLESGVTNILREAGPQVAQLQIALCRGIHVRDIAAKNGQDPEKLARFLATHHVYREVSPNIFANTRISSMLDTLKPSAEILADPEHKHDGTIGLAALASHHIDETFKASAYAWETLSDPATRFNIGMEGVQALQPPDAILKGYDWSRLVAGSLMVDVGGGIGTLCLTLAAKFQNSSLLSRIWSVVEQGKEQKCLQRFHPGKSPSKHTTFFTPQPQTDVSVFLLKQITHDWSDKYCVKILTQLSAAAIPQTTLLFLDSIVPLACHDPDTMKEEGLQEAPAPLLANYGTAAYMAYNADLVMFLLFNSQERTRMHFVELLARTGWEFVAIHRQPGDSAFIQWTSTCDESGHDSLGQDEEEDSSRYDFVQHSAAGGMLIQVQ
ncbi:S-adenosyl-L-methionine-dependent methyltransferase [Mycena venus]|uniref:S-adenosyl-L-methionine-dependent methyltransferase n=1 Tax=Mycena venus TaxID=2733690 RepID=A0A8H7CXL4_9AGAR|nr:S-adenosyl-L-methionine-dependent methyltransferase [Mycena venus]